MTSPCEPARCKGAGILETMTTSLFSSRFDRALRLAAVAHARVNRKGTEIPYIAHPVHVARLLDRAGAPEPVVLAGLLHDVLEDLKDDDAETRRRVRAVFPELKDAPDEPQNFRMALEQFIESEFGPGTRALVLAVTEQKAAGGEPPPWRQRKEEQLAHLRTASADVVLLKAADALHNAASVLADLRERGRSVFNRFNAGRDQTLWWYQSIATIAMQRLPPDRQAIGIELSELVEVLVRESDGGP